MADALPPQVLASVAARRLGFQQQHDTALRALQDTYDENKTNLDKFSVDSSQRINDQMGSQGLGQSGIRVDQLGRLQQNVAQRRGLLASTFGTGQRNIENQYQSDLQGLIDYQNQQGDVQQQKSLQQQLIDAQNASTAAQQQANSVAQWGAAVGSAPAATAAIAPEAPPPSFDDLKNWYSTIYVNSNGQDKSAEHALQFMGLNPATIYQQATGNYRVGGRY